MAPKSGTPPPGSGAASAGHGSLGVTGPVSAAASAGAWTAIDATLGAPALAPSIRVAPTAPSADRPRTIRRGRLIMNPPPSLSSTPRWRRPKPRPCPIDHLHREGERTY